MYVADSNILLDRRGYWRFIRTFQGYAAVFTETPAAGFFSVFHALRHSIAAFAFPALFRTRAKSHPIERRLFEGYVAALFYTRAKSCRYALPVKRFQSSELFNVVLTSSDFLNSTLKT